MCLSTFCSKLDCFILLDSKIKRSRFPICGKGTKTPGRHMRLRSWFGSTVLTYESSNNFKTDELIVLEQFHKWKSQEWKIWSVAEDGRPVS